VRIHDAPTDRLCIDRELLQRTHRLLAERDLRELTPEDILAIFDREIGWMQAALARKGVHRTKNFLFRTLLKHQDMLFSNC
jgi:hypothetical protein